MTTIAARIDAAVAYVRGVDWTEDDGTLVAAVAGALITDADTLLAAIGAIVRDDQARLAALESALDEHRRSEAEISARIAADDAAEEATRRRVRRARGNPPTRTRGSAPRPSRR